MENVKERAQRLCIRAALLLALAAMLWLLLRKNQYSGNALTADAAAR